MTNTTVTGRHRLDERTPDSVPATALLRRAELAEQRTMPVDHPTVEMEAIGDDSDTAVARRQLEQSNHAWLAPERRVRCGGQVTDGHGWYRCPDLGVWGVTNYTARYCAVHAATKVRLRQMVLRAAKNAGGRA